jgi:F-type H+-transporting ATPase subunit epsilon
MDATKLHLEILTPDRKLVDAQVEYVSAPGTEGVFGALPGHTDYVSLLQPGEVSFEQAGRTSYFAVSWGYAYVDSSSVSILVENAEKGEEIDLIRASENLLKLEGELAAIADQESKAYETAKRKIERALARITVANRFAEKK